ATHRPADHKDASHLSCNAIATAHPTAPPTLAVARPSPNPHSCARGTAQRVPLPAVSSLGGFRTPAAVRGETFVTAGVRKPSHFRPSCAVPTDGSLSPVSFRARRMLLTAAFGQRSG